MKVKYRVMQPVSRRRGWRMATEYICRASAQTYARIMVRRDVLLKQGHHNLIITDANGVYLTRKK